jgi:hypothetical protein
MSFLPSWPARRAILCEARKFRKDACRIRFILYLIHSAHFESSEREGGFRGAVPGILHPLLRFWRKFHETIRASFPLRGFPGPGRCDRKRQSSRLPQRPWAAPRPSRLRSKLCAYLRASCSSAGLCSATVRLGLRPWPSRAPWSSPRPVPRSWLLIRRSRMGTAVKKPRLPRSRGFLSLHLCGQ